MRCSPLWRAGGLLLPTGCHGGSFASSSQSISSIFQSSHGIMKETPVRRKPAGSTFASGYPSELPLTTPVVNLPKRMILVRHAESVANVDPSEYCRTPDWRIPLTEKGHEQAQAASRRLQDLVGRDPVYFYVSPYRRTAQTLAEMKSGFDLKGQIVGEREDPRLREQDVGNFQDADMMTALWKEREDYGRFFYRFPNGENGADVCDRVSSFLDSLFRERQVRSHPAETNVVIVGHGLMIRLFIKRWFHFTVDVFHGMKNPGNTDFVVLERKEDQFTRMELTEDSKKVLNLPDDLEFGGRYGTKRAAKQEKPVMSPFSEL